MFGSRVNLPRPILLFIVYGIFLVIVGITAMSQAIMVSVQFSSATLEAAVGSDAATIRTFANGFLEPADLTSAMTPARIEAVEGGLTAIAHRAEILQIEIRATDGTVLASNVSSVRGQHGPLTPAFLAAGRDQLAKADVVESGATTEALGDGLGARQLVRAYFPLIGTDGQTQAVIGIWRDAVPLFTRLDAVRRDVVLLTLSAAIIVSIFLYLIFRSAQRRIIGQTVQLLDASRRDPLTGLLNHGAIVGELAVAVEGSRADHLVIGVALIDLDNFRGLNDVFGHAAGDGVLVQLARMVASELPNDALGGRYGPDEYLVVAPASVIAELEPMIDRIRARLVDETLAVDSAERLPISISAGIAVYPEVADSVTELLSAAAVALSEAKASGGDAVRVAGRTHEVPPETRAFDTLQGLIFAVDTKDRYTKRHSEDVARYGVFLAERLGLDPGYLETVRAAGLLHDVGKIGIPDAVLRKPGKLTEEEFEIVKQHVALGDSIVRNIDNLDHVRAGIRHHHERWDGQGYLHRLAGEDIPLIGRILAIGDAFSAMTTTRPYRKALSVEEALRRLGDAAGTQLDERLVVAFIGAFETAENPPLPGQGATTPLWVPRSQVA